MIAFETDALLQQNGIAHGFFGRRGGASAGIYDSLNCGFGTEDTPENTAQNRARLCAALRTDPAALLTLYQVHSATCVTVTAPWAVADKPQADAMVTDRPGLALGILTADCAPVLFYGETPDSAPVIGAAHAGWGGALKGVLANTVADMTALGAVPDTIRAVIGPCIHQPSYEVSDEFRAPFVAQDPDHERFFAPADREGHFMFDLPGYAARRLAQARVGHISTMAHDTYSRTNDYFSYRRSIHSAEPDYGRQLSVIAIR